MRGLDFGTVHRHIGMLWKEKKNYKTKKKMGRKVKRGEVFFYPTRSRKVFVFRENKLEFQCDKENV